MRLRSHIQNFILMKSFSCLLLIFLFTTWPLHVFSFTGQLDINTATQKELTQVPLIGKGIAQAIIRYRRENGGFTSLKQLLEVSDIGPKTYKAIKPYFVLRKHGGSHEALNPWQNTILLLPDSLYFDALIDYIRMADTSIDMAMFIFKTTKSQKNRPRQLTQELIKARKRGVQVRIILEKSGYEDSINTENEKVAAKLRKSGIKVIFDSPKRTSHAKLVIVDKRYSFVGSHNLTHSALAFNHEISLLIDNRQIARDLLAYIETIAN